MTGVQGARVLAIGAQIGSRWCLVVGLVEALGGEFALFLVDGHRCALHRRLSLTTFLHLPLS